ncbi:MAG: dephospho-CoA kinase [Acidobacteriales bacterium]|nr:dephospho-CoA kinase [Terriglobales bacterium]
MLRVGLTGGMACGKTTVGRMMEARGARLIQADQVAHELMQPGRPVYDEVVRHFGPEIVHPVDKTLLRAKLAEIAFGQGRIQELNAIVHPAVIARQNVWMEEQGARDPHAVVVVEAALILEAGVAGRFDKIVIVTCTAEQKIARYVERTVPEEAGAVAREAARREAERRMAAQIPDEEKIKVADYVIDNGGSLEATERQVEGMMKELMSLAKTGARSKK